MAMVDVIEEMDKTKETQRSIMIDMYQEVVDGLLRYQEPRSKLFYQIVDKPNVEGNYLETSGSVMVAYAILKGCSLEIVSQEKYVRIGMDILEAITQQKLMKEKEKLYLLDNCLVAGLGPQDDRRRDGSIAYYLSEPVGCDDKKGVGTYFMAVAQSLKLNQ